MKPPRDTTLRRRRLDPLTVPPALPLGTDRRKAGLFPPTRPPAAVLGGAAAPRFMAETRLVLAGLTARSLPVDTGDADQVAARQSRIVPTGDDRVTALRYETVTTGSNRVLPCPSYRGQPPSPYLLRVWGGNGSVSDRPTGMLGSGGKEPPC